MSRSDHKNLSEKERISSTDQSLTISVMDAADAGQSADDMIPKWAVVSYKWHGEGPIQIAPRPHGNSSRKTEPYIRTLPSVFQRLKEEVLNNPEVDSKAIVEKVSKTCASEAAAQGSLDASMLPRGISQVFDLKKYTTAPRDPRLRRQRKRRKIQPDEEPREGHSENSGGLRIISKDVAEEMKTNSKSRLQKSSKMPSNGPPSVDPDEWKELMDSCAEVVKNGCVMKYPETEDHLFIVAVTRRNQIVERVMTLMDDNMMLVCYLCKCDDYSSQRFCLHSLSAALFNCELNSYVSFLIAQDTYLPPTEYILDEDPPLNSMSVSDWLDCQEKALTIIGNNAIKRESEQSRSFVVTVNEPMFTSLNRVTIGDRSDVDMTCTCALFQENFRLCPHALAVAIYTNVSEKLKEAVRQQQQPDANSELPSNDGEEQEHDPLPADLVEMADTLPQSAKPVA